MKTVDQIEQKTAVALTRKEKLLRWSGLVRAQPLSMYVFHMLEHWDKSTQDMSMEIYFGHYGHAVRPNVFSVAAADTVFKVAGLKDSSPTASMQFFELSLDDVHAFSCNCGGEISNSEMASRIERLANGVAPAKAAPSTIRFMQGLPARLFG